MKQEASCFTIDRTMKTKTPNVFFFIFKRSIAALKKTHGVPCVLLCVDRGLEQSHCIFMSLEH